MAHPNKPRGYVAFYRAAPVTTKMPTSFSHILADAAFPVSYGLGVRIEVAHDYVTPFNLDEIRQAKIARAHRVTIAHTLATTYGLKELQNSPTGNSSKGARLIVCRGGATSKDMRIARRVRNEAVRMWRACGYEVTVADDRGREKTLRPFAVSRTKKR